MLRYFFITVGGAGVIVALVLLLWQPDALKKTALDHALMTANRQLPYTVSVGEVHGNLFRTMSLHEIQVFSKPEGTLVLRIPSLTFRIAWMSLISKTIDLRSFSIPLEGGRLEGTGIIHLKSPQQTKFSIKTVRFPFQALVPESVPLPPALQGIHSGHWTVQTASGQWNVHSFGQLDEADLKMDAQGQGPRYNGRIIWKNVALAKIGFPQGHQRASADLQFSGVTTDLEHSDVNGRVTFYALNPRHEPVPWGAADLQLRKGQGSFRFHTELEGVKAVVQAVLNLPRRQIKGDGRLDEKNFKGLSTLIPSLQTAVGEMHVQGNFSLRNDTWSGTISGQGHALAWEGASLKKVSLTSTVSEHGTPSLHLSLEDFALHAQEGPFDFKTVSLTLQPRSARYWDTMLSLRFRNDLSLDTEGRLHKKASEWRFAMHRATLGVPHQMLAWQLAQPEAVIRYLPSFLAIEHLNLKRGKERVSFQKVILEKSGLSATVDAPYFDPTFFNLWAPEVNIGAGGQAHVRLQVSGRWPHLMADGALKADMPTLQLETWGMDFHDVHMAALFSRERITLQNMVAQTKKGSLQIKGEARLPHLDFSLEAKNLTLQKDKEIKAKGNATLYLKGTVGSPELLGDITLVNGLYDLGKAKKKRGKEAPRAASLSQRNPSFWTQTHVDITGRWDRDVWYRDGVTGIETQGDLRFQKARGTSDLLLKGQITSLQGSYYYYGKEFSLESGQLQFTGTPEMNPLLNIEASYRADPTLIYLDVTGRLKEPVLKLRSNPPLPEQDILSVLVFGRPLHELKTIGDGGTTNQGMASLAGGVLGSYVTKSLRETGIGALDVDLLNIEPTGQGTNRLTVGRYMTRNLFVSYAQTVAATTSATPDKGVTADYYLGKHWTIEGGAGSSALNHLDFLFRFPLNGRAAHETGSLRQSPFRNTLTAPDSPLAPLQK